VKIELGFLAEGIMTEQSNGHVVHVRFEGQSRDIALADLGIHPESGDSTVRQALARFLDLPEGRLSGHVLDRHPTGNLTLRPEAVFG
jgi:hypothetical protein